RAPRSARVSTLKKCLTAPTLSETPGFVNWPVSEWSGRTEAGMLVLHAVVNAIELLVIPLLLALLLFKVRVRLVAPLRRFTLAQYAKVFIRLFAAVVMWVFLISVCVLYSFIHPSGLAYVAEALVVLWYFYIPF